MASELAYHEFANLYPLLEGEDFEAMKADIKHNGLRLAIVMAPDGRILDGRNRYRACIATETPPRFEEYEGDDSPTAMLRYVVSLNGPRRHLESGQKAAIAVEASELMTRLITEAAARLSDGQRSGGRGRKKNSPQRIEESLAEPESNGEVAQQVAEIFGTNRQYVHDANRLREASPALFQEVKSGTKTIPAAIREMRSNSPAKPKGFDIDHASKQLRTTVRKSSDKWPKGNHKVFASILRSVAKEFDQ